MAITKVINDAVDLNQTSDYSGLRLPVGTTGNVIESFTTDYLVVAGGGGGGQGYYGGGGGAGGLRTSYNNSTTTTNTLSFPSGKTAIATYMLDNNATDISDSYDGAEANITYNTGKYGGAAVFNGSSSRIALPKLTGLTADVSVSGWVNLGSTTTSNRIRFIELNTNANGYAGTISVLYRPSDGQWQVRAGNGNSQSFNVLTHTYQLTQSTWYNVCFTRDDSTNVTKFYINGSLQDTETVSVSSSYPSNATGVIGDLNYSAGLNYNWLGEIDQIRIYDTALSSTDVTNIYNNEVQANSGGGVAAESSLTLTAGVAYDVTVGDGAIGGKTQSGTADDGNNSIFHTITSAGGGGGQNRAGSFGSSGGSGGGAALPSDAGGSGTLNQGYAGGSLPALKFGAGGGGASEIGLIPLTDYNQSPQRNSLGAPGGDGLSVSITGVATYYSGGGGGGARNPGPDAGTSGGLGGGGNGGLFTIGEDGFSNTGGGGGGGGDNADDGGSGASGVVILRYPTADVSSFTTTGTLNTPSTTDTLASAAYPVTNTAYYKLDGNATDSSGNGYNGADTNVTWQNGRFSQAAVFNGSSSHINIGAVIPNTDTNYSISTWINIDSGFTSGNRTILGAASSSSGTEGSFRLQLTYVSANIYKITIARTVATSGTNFFYSSSWTSSTINTGQWYNIVATYNSTGRVGKTYLNGVAVDSFALTTSASVTSVTNNLIGGQRENTAKWLGKVDQVRIFGFALSAPNVTDLYNEHYQTQFTDGSDTAILFTEGTGTVTFSGIDPAPPQGAIRTNTSYSEDGSASVIEHYNGTDWKYFDAIKYCTTNTLNFPSGAGCIASYNLDNNVDDIGNTYNGVNSNVTFTASGKFGAAAVFNGSSSKIVPSTSPIPSSGAFSVSAWVKTSNSNSCFISFGDFWLKSEYLTGAFSLGDVNPNLNGTTNISDNNWHHCVLTVDASNNIVLYVDGSSEDTGTKTISRTTGGSFAIGVARNSNPVYYWNGSIDQVRIFNDSLTSDEVSKLYNNEIACS